MTFGAADECKAVCLGTVHIHVPHGRPGGRRVGATTLARSLQQGDSLVALAKFNCCLLFHAAGFGRKPGSSQANRNA